MIGCHVSKEKHPDYATAIKAKIADVENRHSVHMNAVQIFAMGPRNWNVNIDNADQQKIRALTRDGLHCYVHATYMDRPWDGKPAPIAMIKKQLQICANIGAKGLVVHLDRRTSAVIATQIRKITKDIPPNVILYLEINAAKGPTLLWSTPAALNELFAEFKRQKVPHLKQIGLCIDTAHLWSCGTRVVNGEEMRDWLDGLGSDIHNFLIHLNDNKNPFGSGKDHHGALAQEQIWSEYHPTNGTKDITDSGLLVILNFAVESNIDVILERKEGLDDDFDLLHELGYYVLVPS